MNDKETRKEILGDLKTLDQDVPWTNGMTSLFEWLSWNTQYLLGISKTAYWKRAVEWSHENGGTLEQKFFAVEKRLKQEIEESESKSRDAPVRLKIASPWEALRRTKYFSEEFFNKEFDVFLSLSSDSYLDRLFKSRKIRFEPGGHWYVHGNGGLFKRSFGVGGMQMDNLCYNPARRLLIANELKLRSGKNKDQILKYAALFRSLQRSGLLVPETRLVLIFFGMKHEVFDKEVLLKEEASVWSKGKNKDAPSLEELKKIVRSSEIQSMTWQELVAFNREYARLIDHSACQVEWKLIDGFTMSLEERLKILNTGSH